MSESILSGRPSILACPNCGQMIYSDSTECRFCSAAIDPVTAAAGAELQKKVNDACNLAKVTRHMATAMWGLFLLGLLSGVARLAVVGLFFAVPASVLIWQIKYGSLQTTDPDYKKAQRDRWIALALWLPVGLLQLIMIAVSILIA